MGTFSNLIALFKKILLLLFIYEISRVLFYAFNFDHFESLSLKEFFICFFYGLRFDLSAIILTNSLFIVLYLLPFPFRNYNGYQNTLRCLFYVINGFAFLLNCIDIAYFRFIFKRSTSDVFDLIATGNDFISLIPAFLVDYWFIIFIWMSLVIVMIYGHRTIEKKQTKTPSNWQIKDYIVQFVIFIVFSGLGAFGYRGGFQLKPISILNAGEYGSAKNIPLIINTPFSILKTLEVSSIDETVYFSEDELKQLYSPVSKFPGREFKPMNVVIIIMESFSKEYIGAFNEGGGYTPFLDSLIANSLTFDNAFANGKKSMEGIPAVVAGIPALMTEPYITSNYAGNDLKGIAGILKSKGYYTAFYHGGTNGTMGFDAFTKLAGFDDYFGRSEYNNDKDYDGHWGIYDEPFFQYFADGLNKVKQPFLGAFFSLSSHHPYEVPKNYASLLKNDEQPIHRSIRYADYSLRKFFDAVSKTDWFNNTLFVLTADHTGDAQSAIADNRVGMYRIPILFYKQNSELHGMNHSVVQQVDIMPSILDYLGYSETFFSFGKSVFDSTASRSAYSYINETYQIIDKNYALQFDGEKCTGLFDYVQDNMLSENLVEKDTLNKELLEKKVKAFIQTFNHSLIHNKMTH